MWLIRSKYLFSALINLFFIIHFFYFDDRKRKNQYVPHNIFIKSLLSTKLINILNLHLILGQWPRIHHSLSKNIIFKTILSLENDKEIKSLL